MIKLYTGKDKCSDVKWIQNIDPYFDNHFTASNLTQSDLNIMYKLEGLELVDKQFSIFKSEEGSFPINYISTGLKTLLIVRYLKRQGIKDRGVDVTECGPNILDALFEEITDGSVPIILRHTDIFGLKDRVVSVNDTSPVRTISKLFDILIQEK